MICARNQGRPYSVVIEQDAEVKRHGVKRLGQEIRASESVPTTCAERQIGQVKKLEVIISQILCVKKIL